MFPLFSVRIDALEVFLVEIYMIIEKMLVQFISQLRQRTPRYIEYGVAIGLIIHIPIVYLAHVEIHFSLRVWPYISNPNTFFLRFKCQ